MVKYFFKKTLQKHFQALRSISKTEHFIKQIVLAPKIQKLEWKWKT